MTSSSYVGCQEFSEQSDLPRQGSGQGRRAVSPCWKPDRRAQSGCTYSRTREDDESAVTLGDAFRSMGGLAGTQSQTLFNFDQSTKTQIIAALKAGNTDLALALAASDPWHPFNQGTLASGLAYAKQKFASQGGSDQVLRSLQIAAGVPVTVGQSSPGVVVKQDAATTLTQKTGLAALLQVPVPPVAPVSQGRSLPPQVAAPTMTTAPAAPAPVLAVLPQPAPAPLVPAPPAPPSSITQLLSQQPVNAGTGSGASTGGTWSDPGAFTDPSQNAAQPLAADTSLSRLIPLPLIGSVPAWGVYGAAALAAFAVARRIFAPRRNPSRRAKAKGRRKR